jgi:hypothetical protein
MVPIVTIGASTDILRPNLEINATMLRAAPTASTRPLFQSTDSASAYNDTNRNPYFRYQGIERLGNLVTTRSNVYAVWITVGYFEVTPVQQVPYSGASGTFTVGETIAFPASGATTKSGTVISVVGSGATGTLVVTYGSSPFASGDSVKGSSSSATATLGAPASPPTNYPDGYTLGAELGSDTGAIERHRAFYIFDRTLPVGFQRGQDLNVNQAILLERFIE